MGDLMSALEQYLKKMRERKGATPRDDKGHGPGENPRRNWEIKLSPEATIGWLKGEGADLTAGEHSDPELRRQMLETRNAIRGAVDHAMASEIDPITREGKLAFAEILAAKIRFSGGRHTAGRITELLVRARRDPQAMHLLEVLIRETLKLGDLGGET